MRNCFIGLIAVCLVCAGGCGRKLPPISPGAYPPPPVADLAYRIDERQVELSWTVPAVTKAQQNPAAGFKILRARQTDAEAECQTCSPRFDAVADIRPMSPEPRERLQFRDQLEPGYKYRYKVRGYSAQGVEATDAMVSIQPR